MSGGDGTRDNAILLTIVCHSVWGLYPVVARKLTALSPTGPVDSNVVLIPAKIVSVLLLAALSMTKRPPAEDAIQLTVQASSSTNANAESNKWLPAEDAIELTPAQEATSSTDTQTAVTTGPPSRSRKIKVAMLWSFLASTRAVTNLASCALTLSYNIALINATTPIFSPLFERAILGTALPRGLWRAVLASTVGMLVIGVAQTPYVLGDAGAHVLTSRDLAGGLLQLLSVIVSNAARILMKTSAGVFSGPELIQQSNAAVLMVAMSVVLILNGARAEPWEAGWDALSSGASSVAAFVVLSVGVFTLAATFQVEAIRRTGPAVYGSYSSLRVLVGLAGSWLWLDEPVENWLEWVGIGIVFATLSWWVWSRGKEAGT